MTEIYGKSRYSVKKIISTSERRVGAPVRWLKYNTPVHLRLYTLTEKSNSCQEYVNYSLQDILFKCLSNSTLFCKFIGNFSRFSRYTS